MKPEATVIGTLMCSNNMLETVLGAAVVAAAVGEQDGGATHAEETVGDEHGPVLSLVPVVADHLGADDHRVVIRVCLQNILSQVDGYDPSTAPHSSEVVAEDVPPHLVVVDDHGRQRRRGVEDAAVDNQNADVLGADPGFLEELVQGSEHHHGGLRTTLLHGGGVLGGGHDGFGDVGFISDA